jgi:hypothetical protein
MPMEGSPAFLRTGLLHSRCSAHAALPRILKRLLTASVPPLFQTQVVLRRVEAANDIGRTLEGRASTRLGLGRCGGGNEQQRHYA